MARHIDADALIKRLGINTDCTECSYCTSKCYCSWDPDPGEICIAISEQPTVTIKDTADKIKVTNCNDNDLISRAGALSCFHDWIDQRGDVHTADEMPEYQRIEGLPSAQPDASENTCEIERKSNDTISRADAIDAIHEDVEWLVSQGGRDLDLPECMERAKSILGNLPSAKPDFDITAKIDKAYDDGYEAGYLQGWHDWGDLDE